MLEFFENRAAALQPVVVCVCGGDRSLPSWQNLKPPMSCGQYDDDVAEHQMSDDDLYLMNSKESSVLTSNLLTTESSELQLEIIADSANLRALGNLCESMVRRCQRCHHNSSSHWLSSPLTNIQYDKIQTAKSLRPDFRK